jgi:hypothetical protein
MDVIRRNKLQLALSWLTNITYVHAAYWRSTVHCCSNPKLLIDNDKADSYKAHLYIVTYRPISSIYNFSRRRPKHAHTTIEKVLQEVFSMWSTPCPLLGNGSLNTFPQKQTRGRIDLLLGNGAVNRLCQQYGLCFPWGPCKVVIRVEFRSWQFSSEELRIGREREREWSESSADKEQGVGWRLIVSSCNWLWLRVIVKEAANKSKYPIQNPLFLVTEP